MNAVYDLSRYPASFNFIEFLVNAASRGATHILFDESKGIRKKYPEALLKPRVESILEPACALADCTFSYGTGEGIDPGYHMASVLQTYREAGLKKLHTVLPPKTEKYTITIRNWSRSDERNSSVWWREFAERSGAFVIEDYAVQPIDLHERMAYYAGAKMNYFVANGPVMLCQMSDYPYTVFMKGVSAAYHIEQGWWKTDLPWANANQITIWGDDSRENLCALSLPA